MSAIPCRRPRIAVDLFGDQRWQADCYVPGCGWAYGNVVKTDVTDQASWHRSAHRAAVPTTEVVKVHEVNAWYSACDCGWESDGPGLNKAGAEANLDYHLRTEHGLVSA